MSDLDRVYEGIAPRRAEYAHHLRWGDDNAPAGGVLHMATVTDEGVEVCEIWQTEQAFNGYLEQRLLPVVSELGIGGEPVVRIVPLHNLYAADPDMIDRIGAVSLPAAVASWAG